MPTYDEKRALRATIRRSAGALVNLIEPYIAAPGDGIDMLEYKALDAELRRIMACSVELRTGMHLLEIYERDTGGCHVDE